MVAQSQGTSAPALITEATIQELMRALGFHRIPSRNKWKMKIEDKIEITDIQLSSANRSNKLAEFLSAELEKGFQGLKNLQHRKKMLTVFFKT